MTSTASITAAAISTTSATSNNNIIQSSGLITTTATTIECHAFLQQSPPRGGQDAAAGVAPADSSESETENNEDLETTRKFLLLVDQLSMDQPHHLSIKDIGIILERLSTKIIDVERLERECEGTDTRNWTIKATIRGEAMRELGVIYNSNYYSISEHPGYQSSLDDEDDEEEEEEEDEEDREQDDGTDATASGGVAHEKAAAPVRP